MEKPRTDLHKTKHAFYYSLLELQLDSEYTCISITKIDIRFCMESYDIHQSASVELLISQMVE